MTIQPLYVLAFEAALLAGNKFDNDTDEAALAKKTLVPLPKQENLSCAVEGMRESLLCYKGISCNCKSCRVNKRKRDDHERMTQSCFQIGINYGTHVIQSSFLECLLGKKLAFPVELRFGYDQTLCTECDKAPINLYFAAKDRVKKLESISRDRGKVQAMDLDTVPTTLDLWAFSKVVCLLGLDCKEVPKLHVTLYNHNTDNEWNDNLFDLYDY